MEKTYFATAEQRMKIAMTVAGCSTEKLKLHEAGILVSNLEQMGIVIREALQNYLKDPRSLQERIDAAMLDSVNPRIKEDNFPVHFLKRNREEYDLEVFQFNPTIKIEEAVGQLRLKCLEPADIADLLEYAEKRPTEKWSYSNSGIGSINAPGTVWIDHGSRRFPQLTTNGLHGRILDVHDMDAYGTNYLVRRKKTYI